MNRDGGYSKNRDELVSRVLRVKKKPTKESEVTESKKRKTSFLTSSSSFYASQDSVQARVKESSGPVVLINRSTTTLLAALLVMLLIGFVYMVSAFFTRELQIEHYKEELNQIRRTMDEFHSKSMLLERRIVGLQAEIENHHDGP